MKSQCRNNLVNLVHLTKNLHAQVCTCLLTVEDIQAETNPRGFFIYPACITGRNWSWRQSVLRSWASHIKMLSKICIMYTFLWTSNVNRSGCNSYSPCSCSQKTCFTPDPAWQHYHTYKLLHVTHLWSMSAYMFLACGKYKVVQVSSAVLHCDQTQLKCQNISCLPQAKRIQTRNLSACLNSGIKSCYCSNAWKSCPVYAHTQTHTSEHVLSWQHIGSFQSLIQPELNILTAISVYSFSYSKLEIRWILYTNSPLNLKLRKGFRQNSGFRRQSQALTPEQDSQKEISNNDDIEVKLCCPV